MPLTPPMAAGICPSGGDGRGMKVDQLSQHRPHGSSDEHGALCGTVWVGKQGHQRQGCQLPAVSQGTVGQVSIVRFPWLDRLSLRACLCICLLGVGDLYESVA